MSRESSYQGTEPIPKIRIPKQVKTTSQVKLCALHVSKANSDENKTSPLTTFKYITWGMYPTLQPGTPWFTVCGLFPSMDTVPALTSSLPMAQRNAVVLPQPLGPKRPYLQSYLPHAQSCMYLVHNYITCPVVQNHISASLRFSREYVQRRLHQFVSKLGIVVVRTAVLACMTCTCICSTHTTPLGTVMLKSVSTCRRLLPRPQLLLTFVRRSDISLAPSNTSSMRDGDTAFC